MNPYSLFTHDCVATHVSNLIIKFVDDTTVVGLKTNDDDTAYRKELRALGEWCQENSLTVNVNETKKAIGRSREGHKLQVRRCVHH